MRTTIHASCVLLAGTGAMFGLPAGAGVLLLGKSGAGKSDLALRLIARGAFLVADDRTELCVEGGALIASAPTLLAGLLEVRGVGILRLEAASNARIVLACELTTEAIERMPDHAEFEPPAGLTIAAGMRPALIRLNPFESSAPEKIVAAAAHAHFRDVHKVL